MRDQSCSALNVPDATGMDLYLSFFACDPQEYRSQAT
jgi:hypothetical protein